MHAYILSSSFFHVIVYAFSGEKTIDNSNHNKNNGEIIANVPNVHTYIIMVRVCVCVSMAEGAYLPDAISLAYFP